MPGTLYHKVFDQHVVREASPGQYQLAIDLHFLNEVSSPQAFDALRERKLAVRHPELTFASSDHSVSTSGRPDDFADEMNRAQVTVMGNNSAQFGLRYFNPSRGEHGIIHVLAPERGITQPGKVIACGDSHTSTHGAFGALAFGIGTSQVRDVLAAQSLFMEKLRVRKIQVDGELGAGVYAKDVALHIIRVLGAKGGVGFAYEFGGDVVDRFSMEERMTLCNLAIEAGARCGYINPDETTFDYLRGREHAPSGAAWDLAVQQWRALASEPDADYDDIVFMRAEDIAPIITWGTSPDQAIAITEPTPAPESLPVDQRLQVAEALRFMDFEPGKPLIGTRIDVAFMGSCTNGRLSDYEAIAGFLRRSDFHVAPHVRALVVPGSRAVRDELIERGIDRLFLDAGFQFRDTGCSLCCGMNSDSLVGRELCASTSNRNFRGRQGSPTGRTVLMSPVMVAAAAIAGEIVDARSFFAAPSLAAAR
ncbi:3-isopropylmalate dehydratase large subunit [Parafrigoribacterium soli]|uniref:3-isopropylmalate dehydratase large subunit n=1 Tax=Parafrigoribacterium soli TaxID=3144663 RepID=UPI0032EDEAE0